MLELVVRIDDDESAELVEFYLRQWFSEMICDVPDAWDMVDCELSLLDPVDQREKTHIHLRESTKRSGILE